MWDKGTNLHHALLLANRHFRKHPNAQPVLLIVTDGEPTSHLEPDGEVYFEYPPHPLTVAYAVRELDNAGRLGAQTTFFRLGDGPRAGPLRRLDGPPGRRPRRRARARRPRRGRRRLLPRLARPGPVPGPLRRLVRRPRVLGRANVQSAKPGSDSSRIARNGASASSWLSRPMPPSQVRWMSRYDGGRLIRVVTAYDGERGLLTRSNWLAHPVAGEPEPLDASRLHERVRGSRAPAAGRPDRCP